MYKKYYLQFAITTNGKFFYGSDDNFVETEYPLELIWSQGLIIINESGAYKPVVAATKKV